MKINEKGTLGSNLLCRLLEGRYTSIGNVNDPQLFWFTGSRLSSLFSPFGLLFSLRFTAIFAVFSDHYFDVFNGLFWCFSRVIGLLF